jgi:hypothetical protein
MTGAPRSQKFHQQDAYPCINGVIGIDLDSPHLDARHILQLRHISIGLCKHILESGLYANV